MPGIRHAHIDSAIAQQEKYIDKTHSASTLLCPLSPERAKTTATTTATFDSPEYNLGHSISLYTAG